LKADTIIKIIQNKLGLKTSVETPHTSEIAKQTEESSVKPSDETQFTQDNTVKTELIVETVT
jgi:hypothetical protein